MKLVSLILGTLFVTSASQETVTLERNFTEGDKIVHQGTLMVTLDMGQFEVNFDLEQVTRKVLENGSSAEIESTMANVKSLLNGNAVDMARGSTPPQFVWTTTVDRRNQAKEAKTPPRTLINQLIGTALFAAILPGGPVKVGESYATEIPMPSGRGKMNGQTTLAEIKDGVARLQSELDWRLPQVEKPAKMQVTFWVEVKSGQTIKVEGSASNIETPQGVGVRAITFQLNRKA